MKRVIEIIQDLISRKFYGKITFTFKNGEVVYIKKEETVNLQG